MYGDIRVCYLFLTNGSEKAHYFQDVARSIDARQRQTSPRRHMTSVDSFTNMHHPMYFSQSYSAIVRVSITWPASTSRGQPFGCVLSASLLGRKSKPQPSVAAAVRALGIKGSVTTLLAVNNRIALASDSCCKHRGGTTTTFKCAQRLSSRARAFTYAETVWHDKALGLTA